MSIQDVGERIKGYVLHRETLYVALLALVACTSFALGRLGSTSPSAPITLSNETSGALLMQGEPAQRNEAHLPTSTPREEGEEQKGEQAEKTNAVATEGAYIASRKGTKYHLPWCSGARTISEENKIWFASKDEAEKAGYEPAKNCKGI